MSGDTLSVGTELPKYSSPLDADYLQYHVNLSFLNIYLSVTKLVTGFEWCSNGIRSSWGPSFGQLALLLLLLEIYCTLHCNLGWP